MARQVILVASADDARLERWLSIVRYAGCLSLPATSVARVVALLHKVRPALVLSDSIFADGDPSDIQEDMRTASAQSRVPLIVLGSTAAPTLLDLTHDSLTTLYRGDDDVSVRLLLGQVLGGSRPRRPQPRL